MSHHYCGSHIGFPHGDARLDITDLFAFSKTVREARVLVETVVEDSSGVSLRAAVDARV
jgi:hypothetical protein